MFLDYMYFQFSFHSCELQSEQLMFNLVVVHVQKSHIALCTINVCAQLLLMRESMHEIDYVCVN